ncbi:hypothetical protein [Neisseria sp.]|uniref:hypothetical protein n=1 Tax=Neisseria sp. TaxID=192066 RepID=UPI0026DD19E7|nr:hypothetical protein [Neisseria sp.]MDO4907324.1 hypothetical protein [Neisseria sp.]
MKKTLIFIVFFIMLSIAGLVFYACFRPVHILKDVTVYRHAIGGYFGINHYLYYKNQKIGYITAVDSWYVQGSQVYGSLSSNSNSIYELYYFYIDICDNELYVTPYVLEFDEFLNKRKINEGKRNFMSGNNVIDPYKHAYNREISCPESRQP